MNRKNGRVPSCDGKPGYASSLAFEILQLVGLTVPVRRIGWRVLLFGDHRPLFGQFGVERQKMFLAGRQVVLGEDRLRRAFGFAQGAIDALVGIDDQKIWSSWKQSTGQTSTQSVYLHLMQFSVTTNVMGSPLKRPETQGRYLNRD